MTARGEKVELSEPLNDGFDQPQEISDIQYAFPANVMEGLMPPEDSIPEIFRNPNGRTEWNRFVSEWFFTGWPSRGLYQRPDVDAELAFRHLHTILRSFEPSHQHKEAAVAWLASRWFAAVVDEPEPELP